MTDTRPKDVLFEWGHVERAAEWAYYDRIQHLSCPGSNRQLPWVVVRHRDSCRWYASHTYVAGDDIKSDVGGFDDIEDAKRLAETLCIVHPQKPELPEEE